MINYQKGYIALTSAIIISILLLTIAVSLGFTSLLGRLNIVDSESKERSSALAEACINTAMLKIANNKDYVLTNSDHAILVGNDTCNVVSLSPNPPRNFPITIHTQAVINKAYTNLEVKIDSDFKIISWQELPNF